MTKCDPTNLPHPGMKPTPPPRVIAVQAHKRAGKRVEHHLRRVPGSLKPPIVADPVGAPPEVV